MVLSESEGMRDRADLDRNFSLGLKNDSDESELLSELVIKIGREIDEELFLDLVYDLDDFETSSEPAIIRREDLYEKLSLVLVIASGEGEQ